MRYYFSKIVDYAFNETLDRVTMRLKEQGFGILTEIDVTQTLKNKLDVDFRKYRILGACNPPFAYKALQAESKIGAILPCNVIVQETGDGRTEVSAVNPIASMQAVDNKELGAIAGEVKDRLQWVVEGL